MADRRTDWPPPGPPGPQWPMHPPPYSSGLVPAQPSRPIYREPHPVRPGAFAAGVCAGLLWLLLIGLLGRDLSGYVMWTSGAGAVAWLVAVLFTRLGDRGVAAGIALAVSAAWSITALAVATRWAATGNWPLW